MRLWGPVDGAGEHWTPTPTAALLNFHLKAGSRLAMCTGVPGAVALSAGTGLSPDRGATLRLMANALVSH